MSSLGRQGDLPERRLARSRPARLRQSLRITLDIHEGEFDAEQMEAWVRQAASLPGWDGF